MRKIDENRAKNYIKKHERYEKWLVFALCVSLLTGTATLYGLNKPATAMTEEALDQVGIVIPTADAEFEQELIELTQENKENKAEEEKSGDAEVAEESVSEETDSEAADGDAEAEEPKEELEEQEEAEDELKEEEEVQADAKSVKLTAKFVDMNGAEIKEDAELNAAKELEFGEGFEELVDGYFYNGAFFGDKEIAKITPVFEEKTSEEDTQEPAEVTVAGFDIEAKDGEVITVNEDAEITYRYLKACEETEFAYSDNKVNVKIATTRSGVFPEGIELKVNEVTPETSNYNYDAYMEALNENADSIANDAGQKAATQYTESNTLLYDIAFIYEGKEIQPKEGSVVVTMEFMEQQLTSDLSAQSESDVAVVHLPIREEVKETAEIATTEEATDITSGDIKVETLADATAEVGGTEKVEFTSDSFSIYAVTVYQPMTAGNDTFETVLGDAITFGIVTNKITLKESQTNIATKNLVASGQFGNDITNNAEQTFIASRISGSFNVKGFTAYFITPSEYINLVNEGKSENVKFDTAYTSTQLDKIVDDMLLYTRTASADLASRESATNQLNPDRSDSDKYEIDITGQGAGTYYITFDNSDMEKIKGAEKLRIYKNSNQRIVFNVTATGSLELYKFGVSNDGGGLVYTDNLFNKTGDKTAQSIIWNFINADEVTANGSVVGVFISGRTDATWNHYATSSGWLAFPNVNIFSGEWHNTYDKIRQISGTAKFQAYKNVDNEYATVSGFKFTLYKQDSSAADGWTEIETVTNDKLTPHNVNFSSITYGNNTSIHSANYQYTDGDSSFVYKIVETQGYTDDKGKSYTADKTVYYAKVNVTKQTLNEVTTSTYFRVSAPQYYIDESCTQVYTNTSSNGIPVFNNLTGGSVGFKLYKYLDNKDPGSKTFSFTVKVLNPDSYTHNKSGAGKLETLTDSLTNNGSEITFNWDYTSDYLYENSIFFVVTENESADSTVTTDKDVFVIRVENVGTPKENVAYHKFDYEDATQRKVIEGLESSNQKADYLWNSMTKAEGFTHWIQNPSERAFYNTGKSMLRIHKMVVNEFGKKIVRNGTDDEDKFNDSILANVKFRITNKSTKKYVVFQGFLSGNGAAERVRNIGVEHNADGSTTGIVYDVTYNQKAQWTITGLPEGEYIVEEVADGFTFGYDEASNTSYLIEDQKLSRVTKYDVTEDAERPDSQDYGNGGSNYRVVFSADLDNHSDYPPEDVTVGGAIKTVQVCNYYSMPLGPLQLTKNFFGSAWTSDMTFVFDIEAIGYEAWDTAHNSVTYPSGQPMPENTQVSITGDGTNTRIIEFGRIPFRFEGEYRYKITEANNAIPGVTYDDKAIYVKIVVSKKETRMHKKYESITNPRDYSEDVAERYDENFFYLAADITYATDESFSEESVLAKCSLRLGNNPETGNIIRSQYQVEYTVNDLSNVAFNNTLTGNLTVEKQWIDIEGNNSPDGHTSLSLEIWQRTVGSNEWQLYTGTSVVLSSDNNWKQTVTGLPLQDNAGNAYEYCVKESDEYLATYDVVYTYGGNTYNAKDQSKITVNGSSVRDTGYIMQPGDDGISYGNVTITNQSVVTNTIPSTGGIGTSQFVAIGVLLMSIAFAGMMLFKKRRVF